MKQLNQIFYNRGHIREPAIYFFKYLMQKRMFKLEHKLSLELDVKFFNPKCRHRGHTEDR